MPNSTSPRLLLVVLAGMAGGLWLAARMADEPPAPAAIEVADAGGAEDGRAKHEGFGAATLADELTEPHRTVRERPRPHAADERLIPAPGETCLAVPVESRDGSVPRDVRVALFALVDERPAFPPARVFAAGDDGLAIACAKLDADMDVVAFAPGWRPASRRLRASAGGRIDLTPLVLGRGESVSGRVTAGDVRLARAEVEARASAPAYEADVEGGWLGWRAGRYVWCAQRGETAADGSYEISGLEPGEHVMRLCTVRQSNVAIDVLKVKPQNVRVPSRSADFALPAARLDLAFEDAGEPLCCVEVQIEAGDRQYARRTDDFGHIDFVIQPELAYQVTAGRYGFATKHTQLRGLTNGEHRPERITLEPQTTFTTLIVNDAATAGVDVATFELRPRFQSGSQDTSITRTVQRDSRSGTYHLTGIERGSWRVTVRSGAPMAAMSTFSNCDEDFTVDVPGTGTIERTVHIRSRGSLLVTTRLPDGGNVPVDVRLLAPGGQPIRGVTVFHSPLPPDLSDAFPIGASTASPFLVFSEWCAGTADLVVAAKGFVTQTVRVSLVRGEVTPVEIVLERVW